MQKEYTPFTPPRYTDEALGVAELGKKLAWDAGRAARIAGRAQEFLSASQALPTPRGNIDAFLAQYPMDTPEGMALISLAEALLRIPDDKTADAMIRDKINAGGWRRGATATSDPLVRAARLGLSATKLTLGSFLSQASAPVIRRAARAGVRMLSKQFILAPDIELALEAAAAHIEKGYALSFDMLGEGARTEADATRHMEAYVHGMNIAARARLSGQLKNKRSGLSVKLSALHPRYHPLQAGTCRSVLAGRLLQLAQIARTHQLTLTVDAEETERLSLSLAIFHDVARDPSLAGWDGLGLAVQAYQKYAPDLIDHVIDMAKETGRQVRVRLVKGAYWDTEIKRAQVLGLPDYPVWTRKCNTDLSYLVCAQKLFAGGDAVYPMFATHNAHTMAAILDFAAGARRHTFEFQRLHGMGAALHDTVLAQTETNGTIYAPIGSDDALLPYLVRRLMENGANTSFVHQAAAADALATTDPVARATQGPTRRHPRLPPPPLLFPDRANSPGVDIGQVNERAGLLATPHKGNVAITLPPSPTAADIEHMVTRATRAHIAWSNKSANIRAGILERFADLLILHRGTLMALLAQEGFKTLADAQAEIREAIDFARYYAALGRASFHENGTTLPGPTGETNVMTLHGRGVFVCISPWNFPLAIFTGQVTAALIAGNSVIAKPAEQTPKIAAFAVELLYQAGVPADVLQLAIGDGSVGAMLTSYPDIAGVAFTGSTEVAQHINRTLAAKNGPIVPLIAETGGQNAMIVDSSALPEQVCDDVIASAFGSAGQRCSALRVLYLERTIAPRVLNLLSGALDVLRIGDPSDPGTDIGPVIDTDAMKRLIAHEKFLTGIGAKMIARARFDPHLQGNYFAPGIYEIGSIRQLPGEVFGPILHVVLFDSGDLPRMLRDINMTGYGLTFGIHSRIDHRIHDLAQGAHVGNIYINRTQIGAVVGSQPFGGQGLSGTGFKAGGPHYLLRFAHEKITTWNTAASGGNVTLVAGRDE